MSKRKFMRAVNGASSLRFGKYRALLECGHLVVLDTSLNPPLKTAAVYCEQCRATEAARRAAGDVK